MSIEAALWRVVRAMFDKAEAGDVPAARLLLDRLAPEPSASLRLSTAQPLIVVTGVPQRDDPDAADG